MTDLPNYENTQKWGAWSKKHPVWTGLIVFFFLGLIVFLYYKPYKIIIPNLKSELGNKNDVIAELRHENSELDRENKHLKQILLPIQRKAEQLYPQLETAAAIAKLSQDLEEVKNLATQNEYKPLSQKNYEKFIGDLKKVLELYQSSSFKVIIVTPQGNKIRAYIGRDLRAYLNDAGYISHQSSPMLAYPGIPPDISIAFNPLDKDFAKELAFAIFSNFIHARFESHDVSQKGKIVITIHGEPLFSNEGIVTFQ